MKNSILKWINNKLQFFGGITPLDCLVKKIETDKLVEALQEEERNFFLSGKHISEKEEIENSLSQTQWRDFLSNLNHAEELWFFRFPDKYWEKMAGRQGYVILRSGKMVDYLYTFMN